MDFAARLKALMDRINLLEKFSEDLDDMVEQLGAEIGIFRRHNEPVRQYVHRLQSWNELRFDFDDDIPTKVEGAIKRNRMRDIS
jgi:hypothetical protein